MSYRKRLTNKIRSGCGPLIGDGEKRLRMGSTEGELERFLVEDFEGANSEKGCSRKTTGNRVTRWSSLFWGNFTILR
jgi:hypothetical protein